MNVKLSKNELKYMVDFLIEVLRVWHEKGFESKKEEMEFQQVVIITSKLREALETQ